MEKQEHVTARITGPIDQKTSELVYRLIDDTVDENKHNPKAATITLLIDSLGGDTNAALVGYSILKQFPGTITTLATGHVQSAATIIYLAGHTRLVTPASTFLFHYGTFNMNGVPYNELGTTFQSFHNIAESMKYILADEVDISQAEADRWLINGSAFNAENAIKHRIAHAYANKRL